MNLFRNTRAALAAAVLAAGVLGASVAPTFADQSTDAPALQPTVTLFTSPYAGQDPAKAFQAPGTPVMFWGIVSPNASGTVVLSDGNNPIANVPVTDGYFSITIPAYTAMSLGRGTHLLTATYQGNDVFAPSTSPVFTEVIQGQHF